MNKRLFSLSIVTIALAMVFSFTTPNVTLAAGDNYNDVFIGASNLFGVDEAVNGTEPNSDRDVGPGVEFQSYGLRGDWVGQQ